MPSFSALTLILILCLQIYQSVSLECYVCHDQEDNKGKCINTIKTCDYEEDVCLSEISWGSTPYWQQGAQKQYYISKRCATKDSCEKYRSSNMATCTHIWYQDWKCSECCKGDKCNYFIISGATTNYLRNNALIVMTALPFLIYFKYL
ncbi:unnamed protein product [Phyllotreta striolata]|uniref:Uncharacterized protein n=1 Tax=Phyllotreta striolata TaxID=444603 RepID=A0A9N9TP94_PHYSR|nr:unnamed protein product [Phyllotreta striolata]